MSERDKFNVNLTFPLISLTCSNFLNGTTEVQILKKNMIIFGNLCLTLTPRSQDYKLKEAQIMSKGTVKYEWKYFER